LFCFVEKANLFKIKYNEIGLSYEDQP